MAQRVCIIGGGVAGVGLWWTLSQPGQPGANWDVTIIHSDSAWGGHARTIPVQHNGGTTNVDTGVQFIVPLLYPNIDSLINQQDNPPPKGGDSGDMNKDKNKDRDMNPKGGDPKGGEPKDGNQQANGRKPRQGEKGGQPPTQQTGKDPGGAKPEPGMAKADPMMGMNPGNPMNGGVPMGKVVAKPTLPIDEAVVKEVWGHLPDKLRQQVSQYYKEQFMPKYSDLLKQYYSSLANVPMKP